MALISTPWFWFPLLFIVSLFVVFSIFIRENALGQPIHGIRGRCDFESSCQMDQRTNYDTTFLCCEDGTFWPASHILAPLVIQFFVGDTATAVALVFGWEAVEAVSLAYTGSFVIYETTLAQLETAAGSLIADAFLCGMLGVLLGILIARYSGFPGLLPLVVEQKKNGFQAWNNYRMSSIGATYRFIFATVLIGVNFLYAGSSTSSGVVYGPYITLSLTTLELLFVLPWLFKPGDAVYVDLYATYMRAMPLLVASVLLIGLGAVGWHFLANDFFQTWLFYYVAMLLVYAVAIVECNISRRRLAAEAKQSAPKVQRRC